MFNKIKKKYPFIVIEGTDGSGKSTLCNWIADTFGYEKYKSIGGTFASVKNHFNIDKVSISERFSFLCGDAINNSLIIKEQVALGNSIVFDRYYYSTLVYCESLDPGITNDFMFLFEKLPKPDLVIFIKTDFETMLKRITLRGNLTLIEKKYSEKNNFNILIENYKKILGSKAIFIDNNNSLEETKMEITKLLTEENYK
jgi:deoxyguanosine kinase